VALHRERERPFAIAAWQAASCDGKARARGRRKVSGGVCRVSRRAAEIRRTWRKHAHDVVVVVEYLDTLCTSKGPEQVLSKGRWLERASSRVQAVGLIRLNTTAHGRGEDLMAEADAEHRDALCMQLAKMLLKWRYPRWGCVGARRVGTSRYARWAAGNYEAIEGAIEVKVGSAPKIGYVDFLERQCCVDALK